MQQNADKRKQTDGDESLCGIKNFSVTYYVNTKAFLFLSHTQNIAKCMRIVYSRSVQLVVHSKQCGSETFGSKVKK